MYFRELQKQRPGLAHYPLLNVQIGEFFQRSNLFRGQLGDAFIDGDGFGKEPVAHEDLRETFKVVDGLEGLALTNVQLADGHQSDLVARLVLQDLLVFADRLRNFALIQELLCGFNEFAFVIGHAKTGTWKAATAMRTSLPW